MQRNIDRLNAVCLFFILTTFLVSVVIVSSYQMHIESETETITDEITPELILVSNMRGMLRECKLLFLVDTNQKHRISPDKIIRLYERIQRESEELYSYEALSLMKNDAKPLQRMIKASFEENGLHSLGRLSPKEWALSLLRCSSELTKHLMRLEEFVYRPEHEESREQILNHAYRLGEIITKVESLCIALSKEQYNQKSISDKLSDLRDILNQKMLQQSEGLSMQLLTLRKRVGQYYNKFAFHPEADYSSMEKDDILKLYDKIGQQFEALFGSVESRLVKRRTEVVNDIRTRFNFLSGSIIICMVITLIIWRVINYTFDQRIEQFIVASNKLSEGENEVFIDDFVQDRFGAIIHAFNKMSAKLNTSKEELKSTILQLKESSSLLDDKNRELTYMLVEREKNNSILEEEMRQREEAEEELKMAYTAIESSYESILLLDKEGYVIYANNSYYELANTNEQAILGTIPPFFSALFSEDGDDPFELSDGDAKHWQGEISIAIDNGLYMPVLASLSEVTCLSKGSNGYVVALANISDLKEAEKQLSTMAFNDPLTALPNRPSFMTHLNNACNSLEADQKFGLLFIDLDGFKNVNDTLGHQIGDELLKETASRLCDSLWRERDTAFRLGGDEFTILLHDIQPLGANRVAQRVIDALRIPFNLDEHEIHIGASIGIAICPDDGEKVQDLVKYADLAMYNAKREGKNRHCNFHESMASQIEEKLQLESKLRRAIQEKQLSVVYQPIVDPYTSSWIGAEALVRWNDVDRGFISPAVFIPIAEEAGLIDDVGNFVLSRICCDLTELHKSSPSIGHVPVTFNLSASELLNRSHMQNIRSILSEYQMGGDDVSFEITESVLLKDLAKAKAVIDQFSSEGFKFLLDDFGTGYSSFYYLKSLPFSKVKLDKSFIDELGQNESANKVVDAMVTMCKALNMELVAEGVEQGQQVELLKAVGVNYIQGYHYSRPLSFELFQANIISQQEELAVLDLC